MSAASNITRTTRVRQVLSVDVDLGAIPTASHIPKLRVTRKRDGHEMFVNAHEYSADDPKAKYKPSHYAIVEDYDPDLVDGVYREPEKVTSLYTADDLATMQIAELREVPEYSRITLADRKKLRTKQDFVDAILDQRKPQVVTPAHIEREAL